MTTDPVADDKKSSLVYLYVWPTSCGLVGLLLQGPGIKDVVQWINQVRMYNEYLAAGGSRDQCGPGSQAPAISCNITSPLYLSIPFNNIMLAALCLSMAATIVFAIAMPITVFENPNRWTKGFYIHEVVRFLTWSLLAPIKILFVSMHGDGSTVTVDSGWTVLLWFLSVLTLICLCCSGLGNRRRTGGCLLVGSPPVQEQHSHTEYDLTTDTTQRARTTNLGQRDEQAEMCSNPDAARTAEDDLLVKMNLNADGWVVTLREESRAYKPDEAGKWHFQAWPTEKKISRWS